MNKNTIVAVILMGIVLLGFTYFSNKQNEKEKARLEQVRSQEARVENIVKPKVAEAAPSNESNPSAKLSAVEHFFGQISTSDSVIGQVNDTEEIITLENNLLKINFTTKGGQMLSAQLKGYMRYNLSDSLFLFDNDSEFYMLLRNRQKDVLATNNLIFTPIVSKNENSQSLIMRYAFSSDKHIDFKYELNNNQNMLKFDIEVVGMEDILERESLGTFELNWAQDLRGQEKNMQKEQTYSHISYKHVGDEVLKLSETKNERKDVAEAPIKWIAYRDQFFASVLIADKQFDSGILNSTLLQSQKYLKSFSARIYSRAEFDARDNTKIKAGYRFFLGPLNHSLLESFDKGITNPSERLDLDRLVYLGWSILRLVNQYFVIPIFNMLLSTGLSMGIVILILTLIVKLIISPLTYKSFMSSAKMRVLRPQIEVLAQKYPKKEQAMEKQQATMALYRQAGVNPMSGCIPILIQMPLLLALFQFFPTAIELRQQSFLWATDLSTYDAIIQWNNKIPLIGTHISLFCVLMTISNIIYTKFNMQMTDTGQQQMPGMKWMMYLMPLIFFFVLNDLASGLTYYYFISLLFTILLTLAFRYFVNEEKLLAKLETNKKKPKKKSGFMARLEEAQRMQQQQLKEKNKKGKKK